VTIDADGKVTDATVTNDHKRVALLKLNSTSNIRRWTFAKHPAGPYQQTIVDDDQLDPSLPANSPMTRVTFDLPDRVTIAAGLVTVQTTRSKR
jgi:hypothetical protein